MKGMVMSLFSRGLVFTSFLGGCIPAGFAITIASYSASPENFDRFTNSPSFVADSYDLSGIALNDSGRWLTMISPNTFLSSNHFAPATNSSVTFYASNNPLGGTFTTTVTGTSQRVGLSDIWIGTLATPLPGGYSFYDFATQDTTNNSMGQGSANAESFINSPYYLADAYLFGRSAGTFDVSLDMAVGRNTIDDFLLNADAAGTIDVAFLTVVDAEGEGNFLPGEALLVGGDSGAPLFVDDNGSFTLVGINWFVANDSSFNGMANVGNYTDEINAFLDLHSVPEPAQTLLLFGLGALACVLWRRRTQAG
jgi:hypothetical protein